MAEFNTIHTAYGLTAMAQAEEMGTPDHIDALVTVAGGADMLGWLLFAEPFFVSLQTGVFR